MTKSIIRKIATGEVLTPLVRSVKFEGGKMTSTLDPITNRTTTKFDPESSRQIAEELGYRVSMKDDGDGNVTNFEIEVKPRETVILNEAEMLVGHTKRLEAR